MRTDLIRSSRPAFSETTIISESITYLRNSDEVVKTVLIGGVLLILSFLLIPAFVVSGYLVRVLQQTMDGNDEAPVFEDGERLLVDGLKAFAITLVYGLVPAIVGVVFVGGGMAAAFSGDAGALIGGASIFVGSLLALALGLAAWYVIPAATANFARTSHCTSAVKRRGRFEVVYESSGERLSSPAALFQRFSFLIPVPRVFPLDRWTLPISLLIIDRRDCRRW